MSLNVDNLLDLEKRTGVKDGDINAFLSKVNDVQRQLDMLQSGELKPEDVRVPGEKTPEELQEEAEEKARRAKEKAERKAKEKKEEHEKWWRGARYRMEDLEERKEQREIIETVEIEGMKFPQPKKKGKDCLDYSTWEKWIPDDPVSLEELRVKEKEINKQKDEIFEKNNPEFCNNFIDDMKKREKSKLRKETTAEVQKQKGNKAFKRGDYEKALRRYQESLDELPYLVPVLSNMAQCHIKLKNYDDAIEYCTRALFLKPTWVKAYSRRALAKRRKKMYQEALDDLDEGLKVEPENELLKKERVKLMEEWEEVKGELYVQSAIKMSKELAESTKASSTIAKDNSNGTQHVDKEETVTTAKTVENDNIINDVVKDDEKKEETIESNKSTPSASVPPPPVTSTNKFKNIPNRPNEFGLIDTLMEKLNTKNGSIIKTTLNALADVLKDDENSRIYFRSSGNFEKLIELFLLEDGSLVANKRRKFDIALLKVLTSCCINRKNQQLFIKKQALFALNNRCVEIISTADGNIDVDAALGVGTFFETNVEHTFTQKQLHKPKYKDIIPCLIELLTGTENSKVISSCAGALSTLALSSVDKDYFYAATSTFKRDIVEICGGLLIKSSVDSKNTAITAAAREAVTRLLANLMINPLFRKHLVKEDIVRGLLTVLGRGGGKSDGEITQSNALAALMNGAVQQADTPTDVYQGVRSLLVKQGAVPLLLLLLGMQGLTNGGAVQVRAAGLLARCSLDDEGRKKLCEPHAFELLVDVVSISDGETLGHLIRVVAVCLKDGDKSLREILRKKKGSKKIVDIIISGGDLASKGKLKKNTNMSNLVGNAMKTLIPCTQDINDPMIEEMAKMGLIENVIEVLKGAGDGPVRKNTAIVLARLCRHPKLNEKIRSLRGVEILMTLGKELGV